MPGKTNSTRPQTSAHLPQKVRELLLQCLEAELGGVEVYRAALQCALHEDLRDDWTEYLAQTEEHVERVRDLCRVYGVDPDQETVGRQVGRHLCSSFVGAIRMARASAPAEDAEIVAAECVALAETKDQQNWELLGRLVDEGDLENVTAIEQACGEIEEQEEEHLDQALAWARELWAAALDLDADLPPSNEGDDERVAPTARPRENPRVLRKP